jgi:hypothetical protein
MENHSSHREETYAVSRFEHPAPREVSGPIAWWPDGVTTYVLRYKGGQAIEHTVADEADTVISAIEELRNGGEMPADVLRMSLRDVRRLQTRLAAVADELLLYAREDGPDGKPRLSFRSIAAETQQHFTTLAERHGRVAAGEFAEWRHWLVQHTPRDEAYPADARRRRRPAHVAKGGHTTEVYDYRFGESGGEVFAQCLADGCEWESEPLRNVVTALMLGAIHEGDPENRTMRTDANEWDRKRPADAPLCGSRHPSGETACTRPGGHDDTARTSIADNGPHTDPIGRTWPTTQAPAADDATEAQQ